MCKIILPGVWPAAMGRVKNPAYKRKLRRLQKIKKRRRLASGSEAKTSLTRPSPETAASHEEKGECAHQTENEDSPGVSAPLQSDPNIEQDVCSDFSSSFGSPGSPPPTPSSSESSYAYAEQIENPGMDEREDERESNVREIASLENRLHDTSKLLNFHRRKLLQNEKLMELREEECQRRIHNIRSF